MAFVSAESTKSTNEVNAPYSIFTATGHSSQAEARNSRNMGRDARNAGYRGKDIGKMPTREEDEKALVVQDGLAPQAQILSDEENSLTHDRSKIDEGYHAVPPSLTGNFMPPKHYLSFAGLDDSIYKFKISETVNSLNKDVKDAPKTSTAFVEKPKEVRTSALLIQDWDTDSDNDSVFRPKHIPAKIDFVKVGESVKPGSDMTCEICYDPLLIPF
nr:hypothetical protein [Tanacetum cinerariifolium]